MKTFRLKYILAFSFIFTVNSFLYAQAETRNWNGKKCAVILTYDDALNIHLDKVVPMLDSVSLKGTFYLIAGAPIVENRKKEWRAAAKNGHELGNHTLIHPCDGTLEGRDFVKAGNDLSKYTVARALREIRQANSILKKIDGKKERTFAYPCGDLYIRDTLFYDFLKKDFIAARGVASSYPQIADIDLSNISAFAQIASTAEQMIAQIEQAEKKGSLVVFIFHGVGGEHPLNIDLEEHHKLLAYLSTRQKDIWVAPMVEVAKYIKKKQNLK